MKKNKVLVIIIFALFILVPFKVSAMQINVTKPSNENITLEVESSDTIEAVKEKIYQIDSNFLPANQRLIFVDRLMDDGRTLADYNIQPNNTIILGYAVNVLFDANGGKFSDSQTYTVENWNVNSANELLKPTREGYTFKGYYTEKTGGTKFESILNEAGIDGNMTFYAQWEFNEENPKTYDGITNSLFIGIISLIGLLGALVAFKKEINQ